MRLHLLRHGPAVDPAHPTAPADRARPLTEEGAQRTRSVARGLQRVGIRPDRILASPLLRAQQTAELVADELPYDWEIMTTDVLKPGADPAKTRSELTGLGVDEVLCVGHLPHLPDLAALLLTGDPQRLDLSLGTAGLCTIEVELASAQGLGTLLQVVQAPVLQALG